MDILTVPVPHRNHAARFIEAMGYGEPRQGSPIVAGGTVRRLLLGQNDLEADIDVFFPRTSTIAEEAAKLGNMGAFRIVEPQLIETESIFPVKFDLSVVQQSKPAVFHPFVSKQGTLDLKVKFEGVERKVQFISTETDELDLSKLFATFDFTCCCLATDGRTIWGTADAFAANAGMTLRFVEGRKVTAAARTAMRYLKYTKEYGYAGEVGMSEEIVRLALEAAGDNMKAENAYV